MYTHRPAALQLQWRICRLYKLRSYFKRADDARGSTIQYYNTNNIIIVLLSLKRMYFKHVAVLCIHDLTDGIEQMVEATVSKSIVRNALKLLIQFCVAIWKNIKILWNINYDLHIKVIDYHLKKKDDLLD